MKMLLAPFLIFIFVSDVSPLQCMGENNEPIDWYYVYKLPKIKHHQELLNAGVAYTYFTSEDNDSWKLSKKSINATDSIIANTLKSLYSASSKNVSYILYNNEPPNRSKGGKGHTKGVVMVDDTNGLWLIHSVPLFPSIQETYIFPTSGAVYGQSFLCISMNLDNINKVGMQLQYNQPQIYALNLNSDLNTSMPELVKAASNMTISVPPWYHIQDILSLKETQFISFAKSKQFNKELYEDLVAPYLDSNLLVETWPNGRGKLPSDCSKRFKVNNVKSVHIDVANVSFTATMDHSKWAVSAPSESNWICVGDINREEHQKVRGGGTVCLSSIKVAVNYEKVIQAIENCNDTVVEFV